MLLKNDLYLGIGDEHLEQFCFDRKRPKNFEVTRYHSNGHKKLKAIGSYTNREIWTFY